MSANTNANTNSRVSIDNVQPATMIISMIGYIIGLAGMALLGFGSLCFIKILIDAVLLLIPSMVMEKNPFDDLSSTISLHKIIYYAIFVLSGTIYEELSGFLCSQNTLRSIDGFFYKKD